MFTGLVYQTHAETTCTNFVDNPGFHAHAWLHFIHNFLPKISVIVKAILTFSYLG